MKRWHVFWHNTADCSARRARVFSESAPLHVGPANWTHLKPWSHTAGSPLGRMWSRLRYFWIPTAVSPTRRRSRGHSCSHERTDERYGEADRSGEAIWRMWAHQIETLGPSCRCRNHKAQNRLSVFSSCPSEATSLTMMHNLVESTLPSGSPLTSSGLIKQDEGTHSKMYTHIMK